MIQPSVIGEDGRPMAIESVHQLQETISVPNVQAESDTD